VCKGEVIAQAGNRTEATQDPSAHAELLAIQQTAQVRGSWRLTDCTLVVTLEPCVMCLGAIMQAHVGTVIFGADNVREGALGGVGNVLEQP
jgi:tRNA(adenine34) deaminase